MIPLHHLRKLAIASVITLTGVSLVSQALGQSDPPGSAVNCSMVQPHNGQTVYWSCRAPCIQCDGKVDRFGYVTPGCRNPDAPFVTCAWYAPI